MSISKTVSVACGCLVAGVIGGMVSAGLYTKAAFNHAGTERARAQATFTDRDEAMIEFPALVRGRLVNCTVFVNTRRKASSILC